jgi:hypothetical protein
MHGEMFLFFLREVVTRGKSTVYTASHKIDLTTTYHMRKPENYITGSNGGSISTAI